MDAENFQRIKVLVETTTRTFRGYLFKPSADASLRLSDYLNLYGEQFIRLSDVQITDRGDHVTPGDKRPFVAIATSSVTYVTPLEGE